MRLRLLAATALAAGATTLGAAAPAHATTYVTVHFGLSAGTYAPTGVACSLTVPAASDGVAVLDAAVASHCIVSYHTVTYTGFGTFVDCIDEVCGQFLTGSAGTYWNMYENGTSTAYGVDGFAADSGDELVFAYQEYCFC
jgi:hypothetical protein